MKVFEGIVTSVAMKDTIVIEVTRKVPHPLYKKLLKRSKKYKVDTNGEQVFIGQTVRIVETRPLSKGKYFKLFQKGDEKAPLKDVQEKENATQQMDADITREVQKKRIRKKKEEK